MTDVNDTSAGIGGMIDHTGLSETPELDGSIEALVANLRAAKEQLAELLAGSQESSAESADNAEKEDRSAA